MNSDTEPKQVVFRCSACDLPLTKPLSRLGDPSRLSEEDGQDHVPATFYWLAPAPDEEGGYYTKATGQFLVNNKDVLNTKHHPDRRRLNGFCGLDGLDGKNVVCLNGHEVGTERSDCGIAHSTALDPAAVQMTTGATGQAEAA